MRVKSWIAASVALLVTFGVLALLRPGRDTSLQFRVVRPDGQPAPKSESGDLEVVLASGCGVERWPVKTGSDADRFKVSTSPILSTSIASLSSKAKPTSYPNNNRIAPVELHVWQLTATVTQYKEEADSDVHLVIKDSAGRKMIAEIPAPGCVASSSRWKTNVTTVRSTWTHTYPLSTSWHYIHRSVTIRGLGFFDPPHGQTGAAPNGIEIHLVSRIWLN